MINEQAKRPSGVRFVWVFFRGGEHMLLIWIFQVTTAFFPNNVEISVPAFAQVDNRRDVGCFSAPVLSEIRPISVGRMVDRQNEALKFINSST